jgi:hypothetical protein
MSASRNLRSFVELSARNYFREQGRLVQMNSENCTVATIRHKATHEFKEFVGVVLYLAFFFCSITTYKLLLLKEFHDLYFEYSFSLISAVVIAKLILLGELAHLARKCETKSLLASAVYKAFLFSLLVIGFHYFEEGIKRWLHGETFGGTFYEMSADLLLARSLIIFSTFIPFFAFRELRRVLGEDKFNKLFFTSGATAQSDLLSDGAKNRSGFR